MAFHGEVALVTGAASGMGRLAVERLVQAGAKVAALDVNEEGLRQAASGLEGVRCWPVDVTNPEAVEVAVAEAESELGPVDRVLNAAAIMPTRPLLEQPRDEMLRIMDVNYGGMVNVTMATFPGMIERGRGDLVNFASLAGWLPSPHFGAYNASKFAVVAFTEVLAQENRGKGVRVACVCPPPVDTPLLAQAASRPKILDEVPPIPPAAVLDATERALEKGQLLVFPGPRTRTAWRLRRWLPSLLWTRLHKIEGT
ncbi:MAG: SDR family oxidoreductase [Myxococcota bacterium]|nr:SDR family oxidoreductase [Myxococcota bacterium]